MKEMLKVYFENPNKDFTVREVLKMTKIPKERFIRKGECLKN